MPCFPGFFASTVKLLLATCLEVHFALFSGRDRTVR
jgi:hypothetical protein